MPTPRSGSAPEPVCLPGGLVNMGLVHPSVQILKRSWRVLPVDSFYDASVSPQSPIQFEIGSYQVPNSMDLWLFDYEASVYRFSGIDPLDWVRAEDGRFNGSIAFDLQINNTRPGNIAFELQPHASTLQRSAFDPPIGSPAGVDQFARANANQFGAAASQGTSLFAPGRDRMGPRNGPFCYLAKETSFISLSAVVWRTVTSPIACLEGVIAGYLVPRGLSDQLQQELTPR